MSHSKKRAWIGVLFALPAILGLVILKIYPIIASGFYSLTEYHITDSPEWVGFENYKNLFSDPLFIKSFSNTMYYLVLLVPLGLVVGICLALLLVKDIKGISFFRSMVYLPSIVPVYAFATVALWFFNPYFGLVNGLLARVGINGPLWIADESWVKFTLVLAAQWGAGPTALLFMASMKDIPRELYEAATLDGANAWQKFWRITFPFISPVTLYYLITSSIQALQFFDMPNIMTGGGPNNASLSLGMYIYRNAFRYTNMGYASAMSWIIFIIALILSFVLFRTSMKWVFYGE
ncbi:carbohydrate ABC transporter permease [Petrotoga sp. 9PWA.NaAc.5.4]|uniref:carbohydrate ABC transporter permease n=1 Tax=Petrotoga sp. 9PWA.NaAc.5.4 TaxID=1434328 RepID=UPI000CC42025|nr:sugar ABC transporter permease [Petrotoga sp. 9PWA.NaAc.5.4]PNR92520.1 spermidine/putrescine ABC transporter permease [Petrotoga sp. 9PWA.NaAc.5.4]